LCGTGVVIIGVRCLVSRGCIFVRFGEGNWYAKERGYDVAFARIILHRHYRHGTVVIGWDVLQGMQCSDSVVREKMLDVCESKGIIFC
jgi:hypothetical protein